MGAALRSTGRDIEYSCSWPAYLGDNETDKPFATMIQAGCNLWRNWDDIQCSWSSLSSIIQHWGDYGEVLQRFAAPGHVNDPDMLLIGNDCISDIEAETQMAMWSLFAAPLIMGNDLRNVSAAAKAILLNPDAIAINQDPLVQQGLRITPSGATEIFARNLADGSVAVGLYNKLGAHPPRPVGVCKDWQHTTGGYYEACGGASGDISTFSGLSVDEAQSQCCGIANCVGFSYQNTTGSGFYKNNAECGITTNPEYDGYVLPDAVGGAANITINFADVGFVDSVAVYDIWQRKLVGNFSTSFTATVPLHGTAFLRLSNQFS